MGADLKDVGGVGVSSDLGKYGLEQVFVWVVSVGCRRIFIITEEIY